MFIQWISYWSKLKMYGGAPSDKICNLLFKTAVQKQAQNLQSRL